MNITNTSTMANALGGMLQAGTNNSQTSNSDIQPQTTITEVGNSSTTPVTYNPFGKVEPTSGNDGFSALA